METNNLNIDILKALADESRIQIINSLQNGPLSAGDIEKKIGKTQSATSQQLKKLVDANILISEKEGTTKLFYVRDPQIFDLLHSIASYISIADARNFEDKINPSKILLMGLDGSGKTSILLSLMGEKNLLSYYSISPTPGFKHIRELKLPVPAEVLDLNDIYYEAGGQKVYQNQYLTNPKKYLKENNFDRIIYVIDIQDIERYEETLAYFKDIVGKMQDLGITPILTIYLHKFDPGIEANEKFSDSNLNKNLINKLRILIPPQFNYQIYKTSIFTIFRKTLVMEIIF